MLITLSNNKQGNAITIKDSAVWVWELRAPVGTWDTDRSSAGQSSDQWEESWDWSVMSWPMGAWSVVPGVLTSPHPLSPDQWEHTCVLASWPLLSEASHYNRDSSIIPGWQLRITRVFECWPIFVILEICFRWPHYSRVSNVGRLRWGPAAILCFGSLGPDPGLANCL